MHSDRDWRERVQELSKRLGLGDVPAGALVAGVVVLTVAVALAAWRFWPTTANGASSSDAVQVVEHAAAASGVAQGAAAPTSTGQAAETTSAPVWVHVVGAVRHPGVYELASGARVAEAIREAGGVLGNGAPEGVNMARPVADGEQIVVPTTAEWRKSKASGGIGAAGGPASGPAVLGSGGAPQGAAPVDINSADITALDTLPGVGPSTAQKIVADREANGPFASPDDLGRVPGIGPRKLDALKGLICAR